MIRSVLVPLDGSARGERAVPVVFSSHQLDRVERTDGSGTGSLGEEKLALVRAVLDQPEAQGRLD